MLRLNGGCKVTVVAPEGLKMDLAKNLEAGDEYIALSRKDPSAQFEQLKSANPYGFDIVVEATGNLNILNDSINYVRRGGKLVVYGVYANKDRVSWPPAKICKCPFFFAPFRLVGHRLMRLSSRRRDQHCRQFLRGIQVPCCHRLP